MSIPTLEGEMCYQASRLSDDGFRTACDAMLDLLAPSANKTPYVFPSFDDFNRWCVCTQQHVHGWRNNFDGTLTPMVREGPELTPLDIRVRYPVSR